MPERENREVSCTSRSRRCIGGAQIDMPLGNREGDLRKDTLVRIPACLGKIMHYEGWCHDNRIIKVARNSPGSFFYALNS